MRKKYLISGLILFGLIAVNFQSLGSKTTQITKSKMNDAKFFQYYDESSFYGTWVTYVNEKVDGRCTIEVTWKSDNTTDVIFRYANGSIYRTTTKWRYKNFIYDEVYEDGSEGKARIDWFNKDKFALTIVQNQQTDNYQDVVRIYERKMN